jgi:hypothetical protein
MELPQNLNAGHGEVAEIKKETPWEKAKTEGCAIFRAYLWLFALLFVSALFTPRDILTAHPVLKNYFVGFSNIFFIPFLRNEFAAVFPGLTEVALFTAALLNIAASLLLFYFIRCLFGKNRIGVFELYFQCLGMPLVVGRILDGKRILAFSNGLLKKGYISNEMFDFMFNSRIGFALIAVLFMMIAPILTVMLIFFIKSFVAALAKWKKIMFDMILNRSLCS